MSQKTKPRINKLAPKKENEYNWQNGEIAFGKKEEPRPAKDKK